MVSEGMNRSKLLLIIDLGASSSRWVLARPDSELIATAERPHELRHLYTAMLEATAFGVRYLFEAMRDAGGKAERLIAVGGGTKGGLCTRIVTDFIGERQEHPEQTIGASYGEALLAGIAHGLSKPTPTSPTRVR
jgi:xylulokinase